MVIQYLIVDVFIYLLTLLLLFCVCFIFENKLKLLPVLLLRAVPSRQTVKRKRGIKFEGNLLFMY